MNAERKFLFACLIFALVIYAIHAFGNGANLLI